MSRFMTGYNLARVYSNDQRPVFNLNYLLAGSEGLWPWSMKLSSD